LRLLEEAAAPRNVQEVPPVVPLPQGEDGDIDEFEINEFSLRELEDGGWKFARNESDRRWFGEHNEKGLKTTSYKDLARAVQSAKSLEAEGRPAPRKVPTAVESPKDQSATAHMGQEPNKSDAQEVCQVVTGPEPMPAKRVQGTHEKVVDAAGDFEELLSGRILNVTYTYLPKTEAAPRGGVCFGVRVGGCWSDTVYGMEEFDHVRHTSTKVLDLIAEQLRNAGPEKEALEQKQQARTPTKAAVKKTPARKRPVSKPAKKAGAPKKGSSASKSVASGKGQIKKAARAGK
ncbi:MAG: hypothetical protein ACREDR_15950, partial [Blastocatellia bacterium]